MNRSQPTDLAIHIEHLSRSFRGAKAVDDVSLQIPVGSIFGLVGLNGAGKTTLIRHLIGSLKAQRGRVSVLGDDPVQNPEGVLKKIGYLTEEDSLPKWMRVGEMIDFTRAIYPSWDDDYAEELREMFALSRRSRLQDLSKGQRARVGLLVAIAHRPELLILDEPSSGLDPIARSDILEAIIRTISEDGRTVLFSSHLLDEVERVCDSVALMHEGRIIESLTTEQFETRYVEIICRPEDDWRTAPAIEGLFGWRQRDREWSAVAEIRVLQEDRLPKEFMIVERRDLTIERWFGARVGSATESSDEVVSSEVTADV